VGAAVGQYVIATQVKIGDAGIRATLRLLGTIPSAGRGHKWATAGAHAPRGERGSERM